MSEPQESAVTRRRLAKHQGYKHLMKMALQVGEQEHRAVMRKLAREDLFFLLIYVLDKSEFDNDWGYESVEMVEQEKGATISLWFRGAGKSKIKTFARNIQRILVNQNIKICIISYNKEMAASFVTEIKTELESNHKLQELFPEIFYENPERDSPKWTEKAICVKRDLNEKEMTVEGFGLVDSQPTGKHFNVLHYDDIVVESSVTSSDAIEKTTSAWATSLNLGNTTATKRTITDYVGTRWHHNDTYSEIIKRGAAVAQIRPCTKNGRWPGESVFLPQDFLEKDYSDKGARVFNAQMLLDPTPSDTALFKLEYIEKTTWVPNPVNLNIYFFCDPNNFKEEMSRKSKGKADYFAAWAIGLGADRNYYALDFVRSKLTKNAKIRAVFSLAERWHPLNVFYFSGGENSDVSDIETKQKEENFRFPITPIPNSTNKHLLIPELEGIFQSRKFYYPAEIWSTDHNGNRVNLIKEWIDDEYLKYPFGAHDDGLDALSMIKHPKVKDELRFPNRGEVQRDPTARGGVERHDSYEAYNPLEQGLDDDSRY